MSEWAVQVNQISKRYALHRKKPFLANEALNRFVLRRDNRDIFWALQDVTFKVAAGESVALVGKNGAGKSTLLGIISGVISPTSGTISTRGRIGALLELGAGFHPDLTGRENIFLNASLLGLSRREVLAAYDQIVEFSELQEFVDVSLSKYSSGMKMRLGFSVAIHLQPDIVIMDECFAVGDKTFREKCFNRIHEFRKSGKTLLFVTHELDKLVGICDRAIWLGHGRVREDGPLDEIIERYKNRTD